MKEKQGANTEQDNIDLERLRQRYADDKNSKPHLQLAVMFIDRGDYKNAFKEIRYVLKHHPTNRFALSLGGELIVRFKLGVVPCRCQWRTPPGSWRL